MEEEKIEKLANLINRIRITEDNKEEVQNMKKLMKKGRYVEALRILQNLNEEGKVKLRQDTIKENKSKIEENEETKDFENNEESNDDNDYEEQYEQENEEEYITNLKFPEYEEEKN